MKQVYREYDENSEDRTTAVGGGQLKNDKELKMKSNKPNYLLISVIVAYVLGIF